MIISRVDNLFVVKIFKKYLDEIDIYDKDCISSFFQKILVKLREKYDLSGLVDAKVYINDGYGMIMEFDNVYKYDDEIDIKINFNIDCLFLWEVNDIDSSLGNIYYYDGKYYCDDENSYFDSEVIYKNCLDIINKGIKIK